MPHPHCILPPAPKTSPLAPAADQPILISNCQHRFLLVPARRRQRRCPHAPIKQKLAPSSNILWTPRLADSAEIWDGMVAASRAYEVPIVGGHHSDVYAG